MHAFVTGGSGFLGLNILHALADPESPFTSATVFALANSEAALGQYGPSSHAEQRLEVTFVAGDIRSVDSVASAMESARPDVVFHVAGDTSFWDARYAAQREINVGGTAAVLAACARASVPRLVYTSSVDVELDPMPDGYAYALTKIEAEALVLQARVTGLEVVILRPGMLLGPCDWTLQFGRVFVDLLTGSVPAVPPGSTSLTCVRAVAAAHLAAAVAPAATVDGLAFALGGHNMSYADIFAAIAAKLDVQPPSCILPSWALVIYGWFSQAYANLVSHTHPELNPGQARYMSVVQHVDSSAAAAALGYIIPPLDDIIDRAHEWYADNGFL